MDSCVEPRSVWPGVNGARQDHIRLRPLRAGDCLEQLTGMLHRAFSRLGEMGISCTCVDQSTEVTRQRIARGECYVALSGEQVVGTVTLYPPDAHSESRHYRTATVASVRQLGVDPQFQGTGVGAALLRLAEQWAQSRGYETLALDTPEQAGHLVDYYHRLGFRVIDRLQFSGRPYRSVVFAKSLPKRAAGHRPLCPNTGAVSGLAPRFQASTSCSRRRSAMPASLPRTSSAGAAVDDRRRSAPGTRR
jgi:GNAT superfamily N-acetyltransferase